MEKRESHSHTVDVIKSASGLTIYSTIDRGNLFLHRTHEGYESPEDADKKISGELRTRYRFDKLWTALQRSQEMFAGLLIIRDVFLSNRGGDNDALAIIGLLAGIVITGIINAENINSAVLTSHRLLALDEARKGQFPQYQQVFLLNPEESSQQ